MDQALSWMGLGSGNARIPVGAMRGAMLPGTQKPGKAPLCMASSQESRGDGFSHPASWCMDTWYWKWSWTELRPHPNAHLPGGPAGRDSKCRLPVIWGLSWYLTQLFPAPLTLAFRLLYGPPHPALSYPCAPTPSEQCPNLLGGQLQGGPALAMSTITCVPLAPLNLVTMGGSRVWALSSCGA